MCLCVGDVFIDSTGGVDKRRASDWRTLIQSDVTGPSELHLMGPQGLSISFSPSSTFSACLTSSQSLRVWSPLALRSFVNLLLHVYITKPAYATQSPPSKVPSRQAVFFLWPDLRAFLCSISENHQKITANTFWEKKFDTFLFALLLGVRGWDCYFFHVYIVKKSTKCTYAQYISGAQLGWLCLKHKKCLTQ